MKKLMTLATLLVLLLVAFAPLVLAQQDVSQTEPMDTAPADTAPTDTAPADTAPAPPAPGVELTLEDPFSLDENGNLAINCDAVFRNLALLDRYRSTPQESDPRFQADLANTQGLSQICVDNGLASFGQVSDDSGGAAFEQYQT